MRRFMIFLCIVIGYSFCSSNTSAPIPMSRYLEFARASADWIWDHYDSLLATWRQTLDPKNVFGYRPPPRFLEMATIYATLYEREGNEEYANRAKKDRVIHVGIKRALRMDMVRDWRRPKYTYESGRIQYNKLETNGDFFYTARSGEKLAFTIVNLTKAVYGDHMLLDQKPSLYGLAFDGSPDAPGVGKVRYWRDEIKLRY